MEDSTKEYNKALALDFIITVAIINKLRVNNWELSSNIFNKPPILFVDDSKDAQR